MSTEKAQKFHEDSFRTFLCKVANKQTLPKT